MDAGVGRYVLHVREDPRVVSHYLALQLHSLLSYYRLRQDCESYRGTEVA